MKSLLTLLFSCLCITGMAKNATFEKLNEVNKCWSAQTDISKNQPAPKVQMTERGWIQYHLQLVEQILRNRSVAGLTPQQAANRAKCLNYLNSYWHAQQFPTNEDYTYRTPIFIDKHDNFCAVGYLVKASGHEEVSRKIAANTNLAYVKEMNYPELNSWAVENGFSIDELAWIQPGYPPVDYTLPVGKGVDGSVNEMYADNVGEKLYVGGKFTNVDSTLTANNIAYVTEDAGVFTWHTMGHGVNGPVHAIAKHNNNVFVAGHFTMAGDSAATNVAYWDGTNWHSAGCTYGTIYDLATMDGELYAIGRFDVCAALSEVNFAKWTGTRWQQIVGLNGKVNTMHVMGSTLVLGGAFTYQTSAMNVIKWSVGAGFTPFISSIMNEVNDFEMFKDTLYAVCRRTDAVDTANLMVRLQGNSWTAIANSYTLNSFIPYNGTISFNTLCAQGDQLMMGGNFFFAPMMGTYATNCIDMSPQRGGAGKWFEVDSAINKMVIFKGNLIAGGKFKTGKAFSWQIPTYTTLNGIASRQVEPTAVPIVRGNNSFTLFPNPVSATGSLTLKNNFNASHFSVCDLTGKKILGGSLKLQETQQIGIPQLAAGCYLLQLSNDKQDKATQRFIIQ